MQSLINLVNICSVSLQCNNLCIMSHSLRAGLATVDPVMALSVTALNHLGLMLKVNAEILELCLHQSKTGKNKIYIGEL